MCFDLQNVLTCPKAEVGKFFYKSKLSVYNLTAHLSLNNQVYCAIWSENLFGRKGTDIASALIKILSNVKCNHPEIEHLTLWSDSCVPQNRNSIISCALTQFLSQADNKVKYYSPLSLIRILLKVHLQTPYQIIQMKSSDFKNNQNLSSKLQYEKVPF